MRHYYKGEFTLQTQTTDTIESLNAYFSKIGSRQKVIKRRYRRNFKFALVHWSSQGMFIDAIFDLGEKLHCKPIESIITEMSAS